MLSADASAKVPVMWLMSLCAMYEAQHVVRRIVPLMPTDISSLNALLSRRAYLHAPHIHDDFASSTSIGQGIL
jgi:hypothetical protein